MFWDSVKGSLSVFMHWETYLAGLEYLAISFIPMVLLGLLMARRNGKAEMAAGLASMFVMPVFQVAATVVFVLTLAPIILGLSDDAAWSLPWRLIVFAPGAFTRLLLVLLVASVVLAFVPLLGHLKSLHVLILGAITLMFLLSPLEQIQPGLISDSVEFIPAFWFVVGILFFGGIMSWIGIMVSAILATLISLVNEDLGELFMLPVLPIGSIFGFIPVFIYGAWLGAQIKGTF
jgi:hypothetical protein